MKIDPHNPADLSAQIAKAIRDAIISGALPVDERLPSEAEMAEQFDVSRPTVREALKRTDRVQRRHTLLDLEKRAAAAEAPPRP